MSVGQFNFSIRWLLVLISASGITAVAMANASIYWASLCFSLAILALAFGLIAAIFRRGLKRAYWGGFLIMGCGYMTAMYAPGFDKTVGHRLVTTKVFGYLETVVRRSEDELSGFFRESSVASATLPISEASITYAGEVPVRLPQWGYFQEAGHSAFAIILACLGGNVARYFFLTNDEQTSR